MISFDNNRMQDISLSENALLTKYKQLWQSQDWQGVATFLNNNPELKYKIFDSYNWNRIKNTLNSDNSVDIDYDFRNADSSLNFDFVSDMSSSIPKELMLDAEAISNPSMDFAYAGVWQDSRGYRKNELVTIDDYHLFYCIQAHEASNANKPSTTGGNAYWILCKGFLGELGTEGLQVSSTQPVNLINEDVWIESRTNGYSELVSGANFNTAIKSMVSNSSVTDPNIQDRSVKSIIFNFTPPDNYSASTSISPDNTILAYWNNSTGQITIAPTSSTIIRAATNCSKMFFNFVSLENISFLNFDTSLTTDMSYMFGGTVSNLYWFKVPSLDLSSFDTSRVTTFKNMFWSCIELTSLDLSSFDTSSATNMSQMFRGCIKLESMNLSSFDTSNVSTFENMFSGCPMLTSLDLSSFDTSSVTSSIQMFNGDSSIETIFVGDNWNISSLNTNSSQGMFINCTNIVGTGIDGRTWTYRSTYTDYRSAVVGTSSTTIPAYLTLKTN